MRRAAAVMAAVVGLTIASARARAETHVGGGLEFGASLGRLEWNDTLTDLLVGGVFGFVLGLRAEITGRFDLGIEAEASLLYELSDVKQGGASYDFAGQLGLTAAVMTRGDRNPVYSAGAGVAIVAFGGGNEDSSTYNVNQEAMRGPVLKAAIASPRAARTRLELELRVGYLFSEHYSYVPVIITGRLRFGRF